MRFQITFFKNESCSNRKYSEDNGFLRRVSVILQFFPDSEEYSQWRRPDTKIWVVGIDAAGKTTILRKMGLGEIKSMVYPIGTVVKNLIYKNFTFICWDVGRADRIRPLWKHRIQK